MFPPVLPLKYPLNPVPGHKRDRGVTASRIHEVRDPNVTCIKSSRVPFGHPTIADLSRRGPCVSDPYSPGTGVTWVLSDDLRLDRSTKTLNVFMEVERTRTSVSSGTSSTSYKTLLRSGRVRRGSSVAGPQRHAVGRCTRTSWGSSGGRRTFGSC